MPYLLEYFSPLTQHSLVLERKKKELGGGVLMPFLSKSGIALFPSPPSDFEIVNFLEFFFLNFYFLKSTTKCDQKYLPQQRWVKLLACLSQAAATARVQETQPCERYMVMSRVPDWPHPTQWPRRQAEEKGVFTLCKDTSAICRATRTKVTQLKFETWKRSNL